MELGLSLLFSSARAIMMLHAVLLSKVVCMNLAEFIKFPAFSGLPEETVKAAWAVISKWDLSNPAFMDALDKWLSNFQGNEIQLALKLLKNFDYYTETRFASELDKRLDTITRMGIHLSGASRNAALLLPNNLADSAVKHAWLISKLEKISGQQMLTIDDVLIQPCTYQYVVCFNDTYGTGNQFISKDIWPHLKGKFEPKQIVVLGMVIAKKARENFNQLGFVVVPDTEARNIFDTFNQNEVNEILRIGKMIYPDHPLGYGDTGLLVAYSFQCPNNTIPLIWKKCERVSGFPWSGLFIYHEKPKAPILDQQHNAKESRLTDDNGSKGTHVVDNGVRTLQTSEPLSQRCSLSSESLRSIMCFHQGRLLEFFFLTAGHHKALRLANEFKGKGKIEKIKKAEEQLREYIVTKLESIFFESFGLIVDSYFKKRSSASPRICVKGYVDFRASVPAIQPIARSTAVTYGNATKKTTKNNNTGFYKVETQKRAYLCNDILKDVITKEYIHNPRLKISKVLDDYPLIGEEEIRKRWSTYWDRGQTDPMMCYQSTLIVPMTLINNRLSAEFRKEFALENFEKTIFGFLCFDHIEKDYFIRQEDEDIGYFLADILSLYQVVALGFTSASDTYNKSLQYCSNL